LSIKFPVRRAAGLLGADSRRFEPLQDTSRSASPARSSQGLLDQTSAVVSEEMRVKISRSIDPKAPAPCARFHTWISRDAWHDDLQEPLRYERRFLPSKQE